MPVSGSSGYRASGILGVCYLILAAAIVGGSLYARAWAIRVYGSPQAQAQWDQWRAEAARLSTEGPVKRRVPKSDKPPALVLATTYFGICLTIALVLSTVLFATATYLIQGVWRAPTNPRPRRS